MQSRRNVPGLPSSLHYQTGVISNSENIVSTFAEFFFCVYVQNVDQTKPDIYSAEDICDSGIHEGFVGIVTVTMHLFSVSDADVMKMKMKANLTAGIDSIPALLRCKRSHLLFFIHMS